MSGLAQTAPAQPHPVPSPEPDDALAGTLARAVQRRSSGAARITAQPTGPTLARGKITKGKSKKKKGRSRFKHRPFDPSDRPNFDKATYRHATIGHNLFRGARFDPDDPQLGVRNLAVPHRFSWKNIRDSIVKYVNHDETEIDFRRWTDRMVVAGYDDKTEQYEDLRRKAKAEVKQLKSSGYGDWDQEVLDVEERELWIRDLERHLDRSNARCVTARDELVTAVEDYYDAVRAYGRTRRRYRNAVDDELNATSKHRKQRYADTARREKREIRVRAAKARRARDAVLDKTTDFSKAINNLFSNVSDLGPHNGVNNPVRDRMHLNISSTGDMSPFSRRMLDMTPERVSGVAVDSKKRVVGTFGTIVEQDEFEDDVQDLITDIGPSKANIKDVPFVWK